MMKINYKHVLQHLGAIMVVMLVVGCAAPQGVANFDEAMRSTAQISEQDGDYSTAASRYEKLLKTNPTDITANLGYARNLRYMGENYKAITYLKKTSWLKNGDFKFILELAKAKIASGEAASALKRLIAVEKSNSQNWELHGTMAIAYDMMSDYATAQDHYKSALALSDNNPSISNNMALSLAQSGDLDGAVAILLDAMTKGRKTDKMRQNLAMLYGIQGKTDKAEALLRLDIDKEAVRNNLRFYSKLRGETQ